MCLKNEVDDEAVSGLKIEKADRLYGIRYLCTALTV